MLFRLVRAHIITRRDLADRAIFLTMGSLRDEQRRPEAELWHQFELARPRILGALLEAVAHGLRMRDRIEFARLPRMADFAKWATACETALWSPGTFRMAYDANRRRAVEDEADPVAACVRAIMVKQTRWVGTASDLLGALPLAATTSPAGSRTGQKTRARSLVDCVGPRHFSGLSALTSHLKVGAERKTA